MDPDINEYKTDIVTWLKVIAVHSVKCKIGELLDQRNAWLGNCLVREMSIEELSVGELACWGTVSWVTFRESKTTWHTTLSFL